MIPTTLVLSVLWITIDIPVTDEAVRGLEPTIAEVAEKWEILDPRERPYFSANNLNMLRSYWKELKDAPPLCDTIRFPGMDVCTYLIVHNTKVRELFELERCLHPEMSAWYQKVITDCDFLRQAWSYCLEAESDFYVTVRREALVKLRDRIGAVNYYNGTMPPHVPIWCFHFVGE